MIRIDQSKTACLVYCTECSWRELTVSRPLAAARGGVHQRRVHPDDAKAAKAIKRKISATRRTH